MKKTIAPTKYGVSYYYTFAMIHIHTKNLAALPMSI